MVIYNITNFVENNIETEWLQWQHNIYIPAIMHTGLFYEHRFVKLLEQDEEEGKTYIIQFYAIDRDAYDRYMHYDYERLSNLSISKWGDKSLSFQSLLEPVK